MNIIKTTLLILVAFCFMTTTTAQDDIHFTNNKFALTLFNPAQTGAFSGSARVGVIYRDQWNAWGGNGFKTPHLFIDSPIIFGLKETHWVGVGINLLTDKTGDLGLKRNIISTGLAYHMALDKKFKNIITLGFQYGYTNRSYDFGPEDFRSTDQLLNLINISPDQELIRDFEGSYGGLNVGALYKSVVNKKTTLELGFALQNLLGASYNFAAGGGKENIDKRFNIHGLLRYTVSKNTVVEPALYISNMGAATNINLQFIMEKRLKKDSDWILTGGLGYRFGDAAQFLLGAKYKDYNFHLGYDLTVSDAVSGNNRNGAIEIGVNKIFIVYRNPDTPPVIFCPRL